MRRKASLIDLRIHNYRYPVKEGMRKQLMSRVRKSASKELNDGNKVIALGQKVDQ